MASIFMRIIRREIPSFTIREDDRFYAFLDIRPVQPGHTLVIPKIEVDEFFLLDDDLLRDILIFAKPISQAIKAVTGAARVGAAVAGFDVPHAHLHLIPASSMSDLSFSNAKPAEADELDKMAQKIRAALGRLI